MAMLTISPPIQCSVSTQPAQPDLAAVFLVAIVTALGTALVNWMLE